MTTHENPLPLRSLRLSCEADVLAFVPYSLGFLPADSIVLVAVGPRGTPMTARADLAGDTEDRLAAAAEVSRAAALNHANHALLVAYTDDPGRALTAVDEMADALAGVGVPVAHAFRADGRRWFTLLPEDASWTAGTAYDLASHPLTSQSVLEGRVTYADRDGLAASLDPADPDRVDAVALALAHLGPLPAPASPQHDRPHLREEAQWAAGWVRHRVAHPVEVPRWPQAEDVARVLRVLEHGEARDVVWAEITRETSRDQVALWRTLARLAPAGHRAHVSALLAFAAWLDGDGALAWCAVDRARQADPDHGLAALVAGSLENAVPPSVWTPVDPRTLSLLSG
jgi:hypothetical protein